MNQIIFKLPLFRIEKPFKELTINDFPPNLLAIVLAKSMNKIDDNYQISMARRSIISCFINPHIDSLLLEIPEALYIYTDSYLNGKSWVENLTLSKLKFTEHIYKIFFKRSAETMIGMKVRQSLEIDKFLDISISRNILSWMNEEDDAALWLKFHERLSSNQKIKVRFDFINN